MRLVFLGTPQIAVPPLIALVDAGHDVALVVTGADKRRGRGSATSPCPVKAAALDLGLVVSHDVDDVVDTGAELGVVVAFGKIIRSGLLDVTTMVNLHFSLLPRWRGAAPVERALFAGDERTGVCVMAVEEGLDTGGIYASADVAIGPETTAGELRSELTDLGSDLLVDALAAGLGAPVPQQGEATYAAKIAPSELQIDWEQPAEVVHRLIRVGGAWTTFRGERFKIHEARLVDGELLPTIVQPAGKPRMTYESWSNGARPRSDEGFR